MKKKLTALLCALVFALSLTACGAQQGSEPAAEPAPEATAPELAMEIAQADWDSYRQTVELDTGITMAYVEMGVADGEPLLLVHGMTDNSRSWSLIAPYFTEAGYHVYMVDLRGHGETDKPDSIYAYSDYAADLNSFMDKKGIDKADVVGHSLGSMIAQAFLMYYPERCESVTLESSRAVTASSELGDFYDLAVSLGADGHPDDEFMAWWYYCEAPVDEEFLTYEMEESQALTGDNWMSISCGSAVTNLTAFYPIVDQTVPVLILWGESDSMMLEADQTELKEYLPQAEFISYEGIGHNIQWENTEQMATDVLAFLAK